MPGNIRCNRIIHYRSKEPGDKRHPTIPGYVNVNVTSGNSKWKGLSPMKIGPCTFKEIILPMTWYPSGIHPGFADNGDGYQVATSMNFENFWQGSKIMDVDLDASGNIQPSFFERRAKMMRDPQPHRRALPKAKGKPISAYFNGALYDYIQSRPIYCDLYAAYASETPEYKELVRLRDSGVNLHIIGYDGLDTEVNEDTMMKAFLDPARPFGHELVLSCMLKDIAPWRNLP